MTCRRTDILQWILCQRVVSEREALARYKSMAVALSPSMSSEAPQDESEGVIPLAEIRDTLLPYQLDIKRIRRHDVDDEMMWIIQNTVEDKIAELATSYSTEEISCFKLLLRFISRSPQYQGSSLEALVEASGSLSKKQCEDLISSLVNDYWLQTTKSGKLIVGPRTKAELEEYLRGESLFEDCAICKTLVVSKHYRCPTTDCGSIMHTRCIERLGVARRCQSCGERTSG